MDVRTTPMTFSEFERLPDQPGKCELVKGELIELPPAELKHGRASHRIFRRLDAALKQAHDRGQAAFLGEVFVEMGYRLGADGWLQPDVSVTHGGQSEHKYFEDSPAIAIEIVSPGNTAKRMDAKVALYFEYGAREVWLIY